MRFVRRTKLKGEAKTKVDDAIVATFEELKTLVLEKCGSTESIESLTQKLKVAKQGEKFVEEFATEVKSLAESMALLASNNARSSSQKYC
jgi:hypothetical protein